MEKKTDLKLDWYNADNPHADWDAAEETMETKTHLIHLCPFIGVAPGPDPRVFFSIDVPDGPHNIRSMASGFADTLEAARVMVLEAIGRIVAGLKLVKK